MDGSDALLPMNQTIERTNKAHLDYIKSSFGGMCIKKLRECQNVLKNQFKGILGKFLQGGRCSESMMLWVGDYILIKYVFIENANIIHDTPAGLTQYS